MSIQTIEASSPAEEALRQSSHQALRKLSVLETAKAVIISGEVASYYHKQLAQAAIMPMLGERRLINEVAVVKE